MIHGTRRTIGKLYKRMRMTRNRLQGSARLQVDGITLRLTTKGDYSSRWVSRYQLGKVHEGKVTEILMTALEKAWCFIDVGANMGWYTCLAAKCLPHGVVYSFEMDTANYSLLQKNIRLNKLANVRALQLAVSDAPGTVYYTNESRQASAGLRLATDSAEPTLNLVSVPAIRLDDFCSREGISPDVVKIDVEGAEAKVLRGAGSLLRHKVPKVLFVEVHPAFLIEFGDVAAEIVVDLQSYGYELFEIQKLRSASKDQDLRRLSEPKEFEENFMIYAVRNQT